VSHLAGINLDGRLPDSTYDIVVGNKVELALGETIEIFHGHGMLAVKEGHSGHKFTVVGRLPYLGTPWDKSIISTVESIWRIHGLPDGHEPNKRKLNLIGPPFEAKYLPNITALIVKPSSISSAYKIRNRYQTESTMAFFPAEVLVQLYAYLGNIMVIINANLIATQLIVVLAISSGVSLLLRQFKQKFAIFRTLGASKTYIFSVIWTFTFILMFIGSVFGLMLGHALANALALHLESKQGISIEVLITNHEYMFAFITILGGLFSVIIPAIKIYKDDIISNLK
jgi:putative ABC transport system permease protein